MNAPEIMFPHLGISIGHLNREAFSIWGLPVYWYGIIIVAGIIAGTVAAGRVGKNNGLSPDLYTDFLYFVVPACVVGARLYFVVFTWDNYKNDLLGIFAIRSGGLAIYGAVIMAVVTAIIFTKVRKLDFWKFADGGIVGLVIGQAIGRWGNFFNREAFGGYTDNILAMRYMVSNELEPYLTQDLISHKIVYQGAEYIQAHPTFFYESAWNFALFIFMVFYGKKKKFDGEILCLYFLFYGIGRFWIEGLRTDQLKLFSTNIPVSQLLSALLALGALVLWIYKRGKGNKNKGVEPNAEN